MSPKDTEEGTPAGRQGEGTLVAGKFMLLRLIAAGAVGAVYEAEDTLIGRRVAVKVLQPHLAKHPELLQRFRREAQAAASITHPNAAVVLEMGRRRDGTFYIAQEYFEGDNLRTHLQQDRITIDDALELVLPIAGALATAHRQQVVHRDVKPENIVLARTAVGLVPKLVDFGIAKMLSMQATKLTKTGVAMGTPEYMAPEQWKNASKVEPAADVWSLGMVLYELLSGSLPYEGPDEEAIFTKLFNQPLPRLAVVAPAVPQELADIVHAALEWDPAKRPSASALHHRLSMFLEKRGRRASSLFSTQEKDRDPPDRRTFTDLNAAIEIYPDDPDVEVSEEPKPSAPEQEWVRPRTMPEIEQLMSDAERELGRNALGAAIGCAERAMRTGQLSVEARGYMGIIKAIALYWLGNYADAHDCAVEAKRALPPGTVGWYAALGHAVMAGGALGHRESLAKELEAVQEQRGVGPDGPAAAIACSRLIVQLVRAGELDLARRTLDSIDDVANRQVFAHPLLRPWSYVARGEIATHEGDPMTYMRLIRAAADEFGAAGEQRDATMQRCNVGNGYLQLGGYEDARRVLQEALSVAEPMRLSIAASIRANLGFALARLGQLDKALAVESEALAQSTAQGNRRWQGVSRVYLAVIYSLRGDLDTAIDAAREAIVTADELPAVRAYALAVLANCLSTIDGRASEALDPAEHAMQGLIKLGGLEDGESLIRVVYASILAQLGEREHASRAITIARGRLLARAGRITDDHWRKAFLENVPENARTCRLAEQWGIADTLAS